ncbi:hypothetical protein BOTNAR_0639g00040 [Botryotinia narcissicola]|uniref:Uncharacterized protein n=1 Tax=Botryotinia narcissicola TaxID=278944 RepID=A0A4Z1HBX3_9HELO|nr:hypothetical protein BOTNAR_0639g00040 [Botryotinia narcissicola]
MSLSKSTVKAETKPIRSDPTMSNPIAKPSKMSKIKTSNGLKLKMATREASTLRTIIESPMGHGSQRTKSLELNALILVLRL